MMLDKRQIDNNLTGIWAIFLRRENAVNYFTINTASFFSSFSIVIIVLIFHIYITPIELEILSSQNNQVKFEPTSVGFQVFVLLINWFISPFLAYAICKLMNLSENFMRYIIIGNWSSLVALMIIATPVFLYQVGLPSAIATSLLFFATILMLVYKWWVAKMALATNNLNASIMLFIDVAFTIVVSYILSALIG